MKILYGSLVLAMSIPLISLGWSGQDQDKKQEQPKQKVFEVGNKGIDIDARLDEKDDKDARRKGSYCKVYLVKMSKGKTYQIDMAAIAFDSFLRLEDNNQKQLAQDDDSGGDLNAQILFTPEQDGTYRVICTTLGPDSTGKYKLTITEK